MMLSEDQTIELLAFFVTAARCLLDEPAEYGSLRLLDAAERISVFAHDQASPATQALLAQIIDQSPRIQGQVNQPDRFAASMDALCGTVARFLVAQSGLEASQS